MSGLHSLCFHSKIFLLEAGERERYKNKKSTGRGSHCRPSSPHPSWKHFLHPEGQASTCARSGPPGKWGSYLLTCTPQFDMIFLIFSEPFPTQKLKPYNL